MAAVYAGATFRQGGITPLKVGTRSSHFSSAIECVPCVSPVKGGHADTVTRLRLGHAGTRSDTGLGGIIIPSSKGVTERCKLAPRAPGVVVTNPSLMRHATARSTYSARRPSLASRIARTLASRVGLQPGRDTPHETRRSECVRALEASDATNTALSPSGSMRKCSRCPSAPFFCFATWAVKPSRVRLHSMAVSVAARRAMLSHPRLPSLPEW